MVAAPKRARPVDAVTEACLETLRGLGPSVHAELVESRGAATSDAELVLRTSRTRPAGDRFDVQTTRTHLSYALATGLVARRRPRGNFILFAPYVPAPIGRYLADHGASYVDAVGNCHLVIRDELLAHVEGRRLGPGAKPKLRGRLPSHQLMFAILAEPTLLDEPVRRIAESAGIGKSAAAEQLARLQEQGLVVRARAGLRIARPRELLDRWLVAYPEIVRPKWLVGRYRAQTRDPEALEAKLAAELDATWALGGGAAGWRMTHFYRGTETVVHLANPPADLARRLRVVPAPDGPLTILQTPGTLAYRGAGPNLAHPLLVYTEMLVSTDPRMKEAAEMIREKFLPGTS